MKFNWSAVLLFTGLRGDESHLLLKKAEVPFSDISFRVSD